MSSDEEINYKCQAAELGKLMPSNNAKPLPGLRSSVGIGGVIEETLKSIREWNNSCPA